MCSSIARSSTNHFNISADPPPVLALSITWMGDSGALRRGARIVDGRNVTEIGFDARYRIADDRGPQGR
jgi:hypothetical protein